MCGSSIFQASYAKGERFTVSQRVVTKEDLYKFQIPGSPILSPDGQTVLYEVTSMREKEDDYETQLFQASLDGESRRRLTTSGSRNASAVYSPDGQTIAFLSNRSFGTQVWLLSVKGGEAHRLTKFTHGIHSITWSPDSKYIVGLVPVHKDGSIDVIAEDVTEKEYSESEDKRDSEWRNHPKRYDWLYYKSDSSGLKKGYYSQLVVIDRASGEFRVLTEGPYNVADPVVSPDGAYIAFASNRRVDREIVLRNDLYRVPFGGGELETLVTDVDAYQPSYSPDGQHIAFFGNKDEYKNATHTHLYLVKSDGSQLVHITEGYPVTLGNFCMSDMRNHEHTPAPLWSTDGTWLYSLQSREAKCEVVRFHTTTKQAQVVMGGDREIYGFAFDGGNQFVIAYTTMTSPGQIHAVTAEGGVAVSDRAPTAPMTETKTEFFPSQEFRLDDCNENWFDDIIVVEPEPFWYTSADDWRVQGWVMKPANFTAGQTYPVILEIHGGPHANYSFSYFHEMQWLAAQGYAIVFVNPRGSASYGQEFMTACRHDYGGRDATDILNGLDVALSKFDFLDRSRVAVTGGSYGGFMTNWLLGHTERFFVGVSQRSISNWISFYGVSDIGPMFTESEIGGDVMHDFERLWKHSPLAYAKDVKTPLLLIHNENDLRCPIEQSEQFYTCIKRLGGDVELFRIPNANHDLSRAGKPKLRFARLEAIFSFIHKYLPENA